MAFQFDETHVYGGQHLVCPEGKVPIALGVALTKIDGSQYVQGPALFGADKKFPTPYATGDDHTTSTHRSAYAGSWCDCLWSS